MQISKLRLREMKGISGANIENQAVSGSSVSSPAKSLSGKDWTAIFSEKKKKKKILLLLASSLVCFLVSLLVSNRKRSTSRLYIVTLLI